VDNEMGNLFGVLLGTDSATALEVFLSLRRSSNQRDALKAAAKHKLQGDNLVVFETMLTVYGSLEAQRNSLAHGCFGVCDDPMVLLWIDIKDHVHFQVEALSKMSDIPEDTHARLKENMYVYRIADLETLYAEMEDLWWAVFHFNCYLRDSTIGAGVGEVRRLLRL
jgi:hypothetical protein